TVECPPGEFCIADGAGMGVCVRDRCENVQCEPGQVCTNGFCFDTCDCPDCPTGCDCVQGQCSCGDCHRMCDGSCGEDGCGGYCLGPCPSPSQRCIRGACQEPPDAGPNCDCDPCPEVACGHRIRQSCPCGEVRWCEGRTCHEPGTTC